MADDLGNDWWMKQPYEKAKSKKEQKNKSQRNFQNDYSTEKRLAEQSQSKNRQKRMKVTDELPLDSDKEEDEKTDFKGQKTLNYISNDTGEEENVSKPDTKKKHSRRKITDELKAKGDKPLCPSDLTALLNKHYAGKLTKVELEDTLLDENDFALCNDLSHNPASFMKELVPKWKKLQSNITIPGSPLLLVLCPSALRAANFIRLISSFKGDSCKVAKLFAKHIKLEEQLKFIKSNVIHIGVGTANRIQCLLESEALHLDLVKYVILDWSWRDVKQKRLFDVPEVCQDTLSLVSKFIIPCVRKNSMKLALL